MDNHFGDLLDLIWAIYENISDPGKPEHWLEYYLINCKSDVSSEW